MIYLDHNATTPVRPEVVAAMAPYWESVYGNPQSLHGPGQAARQAVDEARARLRAAVGAPRGWQVVFTGSGTEADNLALHGVLRGAPGEGAGSGAGRGQGLLTSPIEHKAVLAAVPEGVADGGALHLLAVGEDGVVRLPEALPAGLGLVSLMLANNETGALQPVAALAALARAAGVLVHCDAVQAFGREVVDVEALGVDLISVSAHKIRGPKGVGALIYRPGLALAPIVRGGSHENDTRAGTHNVPGIVGFGVAAELAAAEVSAYQRHTAALRDRLRDAVLGQLAWVREVAGEGPRLTNTTLLAFPGLDTQTLLIKLDLAGIAAGAGAACSAGGVDPSHVMKAMDLPPDMQRAVVRFSLGATTTDVEIDQAIASICDVACTLKDRRDHLKSAIYA